MIYQLSAYYGALIGDKVIYSAEMNFNDCKKLLKKPIPYEEVKNHIINNIIKDGFNPDDFTFGWLTKEQYKNKIESKVVEQFTVEEERD
jgi:hypothetical protein